MPTFHPYTRLFVRPSVAVVIAGPHIQIVDPNGVVIASTAKLDSSRKDGILKSGLVRCAAVDGSNTHIATVSDDKKLKVWTVEGLELLSERELPKRPTDVQFMKEGQTILVSDKFGDVFSYPLHPATATPNTGPSKDPLASHENPWGNLVLGHVSLLTAFLLSHDERYIVTADRDEHIRISWYPEGYNIEIYCLGHEKFVSAIHIPEFAQGALLSGGGDPMIKVWDWMAGTVGHEVRVFEAVEPFIKVGASKKRRKDPDGEDEIAETAEAGESSEQRVERPRGKKKKRKQKRAQQERTEDVEPENTPAPVPEAGPGEENVEHEDEIVLVLHKISSLAAARRVVFSAVGATALFSFPFPDSDEPQDVEHFDFGKPVIDFEIADDEGVLVLFDGQWADSSDPEAPIRMVRMVKWQGTQFIEPESDHPLLSSLNSECMLEADPSDVAVLDLYAPLSVLPKNVHADRRHPQHDEQQRAKQGKETSKRALGRLKNKSILAEVTAASGGRPDADEDGGSDGGGEEGRTGKRVRSDWQSIEEGVDMDVI